MLLIGLHTVTITCFLFLLIIAILVSLNFAVCTLFLGGGEEKHQRHQLWFLHQATVIVSMKIDNGNFTKHS